MPGRGWSGVARSPGHEGGRDWSLNCEGSLGGWNSGHDSIGAGARQWNFVGLRNVSSDH